MHRTEIVSAVVLIIAGCGTLAWLIPRYVVDTGASSALPPAFMPYVAAGLLTAAAFGWLVTTLRRGDRDRVPAPLTAASLRFVLASSAVLGGAWLLMSSAGYLAGAVTLIAGMLLIARANWVTIAATAVLTPFALWALFSALLATPLP